MRGDTEESGIFLVSFCFL
ncbi:unnamed protein product [Linum tenue]|uniref:Uncharacterized protein n=1 Tax=Linum tenue TaxID=586396 RepID=A0AAV0ILF8_9ROSI|nr:unnamed protein product [Linum tenue]